MGGKLVLESTEILLLPLMPENDKKGWKRLEINYFHLTLVLNALIRQKNKHQPCWEANQKPGWKRQTLMLWSNHVWEFHTCQVFRFLWPSGRSEVKARRKLTVGQLYITSASPFLRYFAFNSSWVPRITSLIHYRATEIQISIISHVKSFNHWSRKSA